MQKSFIAIALALTLTCAFASSNPLAYVKAPVSVAGNNESNFTNSAFLQLASVNIGELDLVGANTTKGGNATTNAWTTAYRKLDGKALTATTNSSFTFTGGLYATTYVNGYAISYTNENDTNNVPQVFVYQAPINGGAALSRIAVTSNLNNAWTPLVIGSGLISKTVYIFYTATNTSNSTAYQVNVTNFVVGGAKGTQDFNITTSYTGGLTVAWGEALGSNQLFAAWMEGTNFKDATIDVSKGTATVTTVNGWTVNLTCGAFSTDKKWFGDFCFDAKTTPGNTTISVRASNTTITQLASNFTNTSTVGGVFAYGPYIAVFYSGSANNNGTITNTYGYEIWNLDSYTPFKTRTNYLTTDGATSVVLYRVISGGLYTLLANPAVANTSTGALNYTNIQVGLVLGSSYLTSVLGFILTIVAGLLLF